MRLLVAGIVACITAVGCRPAAEAADDVLELRTGAAAENELLPLVVALHGYGGSADDIVGMLEGLGVRARVIAPHGSIRVGAFGWGWFPRNVERSTDEIAPALSSAARSVLRIIARTMKKRPTCGLPIVFGFSQGGFMSYAIAAAAPERIAAAFPIAGMLPPLLRSPPPPAHGGPQIIAFHGEDDSVIPLPEDRGTYIGLVAQGFRAELRTYPGVEHRIPPPIADDVRAAIELSVRDQGCAR